MTGVSHWPAATPVQLHYAVDDPSATRPGSTSSSATSRLLALRSRRSWTIRSPGILFTDASLPDEYHEASATLAFERALEFLDR